MSSSRLDVALVARGLSRSRGQAVDMVKSGQVILDGRVAAKPSARVDADSVLEVTDGGRHHVGRGAAKLIGALDGFAVRVADRWALDAGASTGGFTQVLLERGAANVVAVDVGHDQLAPRLRGDARVINLEGTNLRELDRIWRWPPVDLVTADLSFISLTTVLPMIRSVLAPQADLILLVKPQFEAGRGALDSRGVVTDPHDRADAVERVAAAGLALGLTPMAAVPSAITGAVGNQEFFLHLAWDAGAARAESVSLEWIRRVVGQDGVHPIHPPQQARDPGAKRQLA
ncbi:MAG: TlyA family RNA methyltransferase [Actinobacteria bacterium]|nr:TlyA family RNA methyltransferase [Actinomycetota bacterium]